MDEVPATPPADVARVPRGTGRSLQRLPDLLRVGLLAAVAFMAPFSPNWALRQGAILAALVLISLVRCIRPKRTDLFLAALVALIWLSMLWSVDQGLTLIGAQNWTACALIFMATRAAAQRWGGAALRLIALSFVAGCVWTCIQVLWIGGLATRSDALESATLAPGAVNINYVAYSLVTGLVVLYLVWWLRRPALIGRLASLAYLLLVLAALQVTDTRGALIGVVLVPLWLLANRLMGARRSLRLLYGLTVIAAMSIMFGLVDAAIRGALTTTTRETGDLNGRLRLWPAARTYFWENFGSGTGIDTFRLSNELDAAAHNALLDVATGVGVLGVCLFVLCLHGGMVTDARPADVSDRVRLIGSFAVVTVPILLSGFWTESVVLWLSFGLISSIGVIAGGSLTVTQSGSNADAPG